MNLTAPEVHFITQKSNSSFDFEASNKKFILKNLSYDPLQRLNRPQLPHPDQCEYFSSLDISEDKPWVLQEFVEGVEYCTHSTVRDGKILLHCCCLSSISNLDISTLNTEKFLNG